MIMKIIPLSLKMVIVLSLMILTQSFYILKTTIPHSIFKLTDISNAIRRRDFPILDIDAYPDKKLIYLDSAASSQKPIQVLEKVRSYSNDHIYLQIMTKQTLV